MSPAPRSWPEPESAFPLQPTACSSRSISSTLVDEHGGGDRQQGRKSENGVDGVRILPLAPRRLEICWHDRPVITGNVHRGGERPEDGLARPGRGTLQGREQRPCDRGVP